MENRDFYIEKDGFKIHAKLDFPDAQKEKMPIIIMCHGLTGHMEEWHLLGIRDSIVETGYCCLRVELYGHGDSDGAFFNHNLLEWVSELMYVVDYVSELPFVSDIILAGHSQGGLATVLASGLLSDRLKAVMLLSPALNIPVDCREGNFFGTEFDPDSVPHELIFWESHRLGGNYIRIGQSIYPDKAIEGFLGPVMIIHGEDDGAVPCEYSKAAGERYRDAVVHIIPGEGHCYENHLDIVKEKVKLFLEVNK